MLDKICTDLTTSKRLKELEIEIKTKFYWESDIHNQNYSVGCWYEKPQDNVGYFEYIPCFTLEQILEILPKIIKQKEGALSLRFKLHKVKGESYMEYLNLLCYPYFNFYLKEPKHHTDISVNENLATTLAKLLIKLIEEKK
tara:strand:+ start:156 stop:578 length:423 start_codon:yes stop_codon:yes gene_type:complete